VKSRCGSMVQRMHQLRWMLVVPVLFVTTLLAYAAELRVIDAAGLVRAVKVVRGPSRVVITLQNSSDKGSGTSVRGECVAVNIDGLAAEKRTQVSAKNQCVFDQMSEGSWQMRVPEVATWRAQVYE
jgi:hypothetical protein